MIRPNITRTANSGVYGCIDSIDEKGISGWILDLDGGVNVVEVYINDVKVGEKEADSQRLDIDSIIGNSIVCGFHISWKDIKIPTFTFKDFKISVIHKRTGISLQRNNNNLTKVNSFNYKSYKESFTQVSLDNFIGYLDGVHDGYIIGWAYNRVNPNERVKVSIYINSTLFVECEASIYREDLEKAGIGDGKHAFRIKLTEEFKNYKEIEIRAFISGNKKELSNSPLKFIDKYTNWINKYEKPLIDKILNSKRKFSYNPKISVIMPVYNTPEIYLVKAIESVLNQVYDNWELCIADDASMEKHVKKILLDYKNRYPEKIKVVFREKNGHICESSNSALYIADGDYIAFLDHDDEIAPHALYMVVEALNLNPDLKIIYTDEDFIDEYGNRYNPHFKPDWSPDLLLSYNYIAHLMVIKKDLVESIGGFRKGTEGAQDHDLVLRASINCERDEIYHIPWVLYHWRAWEKSTAKTPKAKDYTEKSGLEAIRNFLTSKEYTGFLVLKGKNPNRYRIVYPIQKPEPTVSIIIPTRDRIDLLKKCLSSIINKTDYPNYEIIIANNDSELEETYKYFTELYFRYSNVKIIGIPGEFNFSRINNYAVNFAKGELLLFLNNDTEVINSEWLSEMVMHAVRPEIGCVGAKLYYSDGTIQHAGVILGIGGVAGHSHKHFPMNHDGYFSRLTVVQNVSAVTAACLMIKREIFFEVGGFDENNLKVAFNDVDFCLKVKEKGYYNLWTPYAELYHHESKSRGYEDTPEKIERFRKEVEFMQKKWGEKLLKDPFYNPNLTLDREDFSIKD